MIINMTESDYLTTVFIYIVVLNAKTCHEVVTIPCYHFEVEKFTPIWHLLIFQSVYRFRHYLDCFIE